MWRSKLVMSSLFVAGVALTTPALKASDFVGVYCLVDKVVLEPNDTEPQRAQVWGVFMLAEGDRGNNYQEAQRGFLYYSCPAGKDAQCFNEWSDLKKSAGTGKVLGLGSRYRANGHLRKASEAVASPDEYPIAFGLTLLGADSYAQSIVAKLKAVGKRP